MDSRQRMLVRSPLVKTERRTLAATCFRIFAALPNALTLIPLSLSSSFSGATLLFVCT